MGVPKRKVSKRRTSSRRSANRLHAPQTGKCSNCGEACRPHCVCPHCGWYGGKLAVAPKQKKEKNPEGGEQQ